MRKGQFSISVLLTLLLSGHRGGHTAASLPQVPARMVPRGWNVYDEITGDLNRDGVPDLVFVLARNNEDELEEAPRRLVVAFRERRGYRRILTDEGEITGGTVPRQESIVTDLRIERGSLVVWTHKLGSNLRWSVLNRYRWTGGGFRQVGATRAVEGVWDGEHMEQREFDANLLTGMVQESHDRWSIDHARSTVNMKRQDPGFPKRWRYHLVPLITMRALPMPPSAPLSSRVVTLADRTDVTLGAERWKGPSDLSATLSAALAGQGSQRRLYVRGLVKDGGSADLGQVRLVSAGGIPLHPERIERTPVPGGYTWQARYDPAFLKVTEGRLVGGRAEKPKAVGRGMPSTFSNSIDYFFQASLEVVSRSRSGGERLVLSTARSRKRTSLFWPTDPKLPRLGTTTDALFDYQPADF